MIAAGEERRGNEVEEAMIDRALGARSGQDGWGATSNLSHPGISPTNLLAVQPAPTWTRPADCGTNQHAWSARVSQSRRR